MGITLEWVNTVPTGFYGTGGASELICSGSAWKNLGNGVYSLRKVIRRDLAYTGAFSTYRVHLRSNWSTFGGVAIKDIIWDKFVLRSASDEEIRTLTVTSDISAAVATEASIRASSDGLLNQSMVLRLMQTDM